MNQVNPNTTDALESLATEEFCPQWGEGAPRKRAP